MNWKQAGKIVYIVVLVIVLVFAVIVILSAIPFPGGLRMYIVRSGSMAPTIKSGDLIFSQKQDLYEVDDIVTYIPRGEEKNIESITHRIIKTEDGLFITKGDANSSEDTNPISPKQIKGKYKFRVPIFGYIIGFAKTTLGFVLLIVIPGTIIIYSEIQNLIAELKKRKNKRNKKK